MFCAFHRKKSGNDTEFCPNFSPLVFIEFWWVLPAWFHLLARSGEITSLNDKRIFSGLLIRALEFVKVERTKQSCAREYVRWNRTWFLFQQRATVRKRCCTDVLFSALMPTLDHWPGIITKRSQSLIGSAWIIPAHQSNLRSIARWFDTVLGLIKQVVTGV